MRSQAHRPKVLPATCSFLLSDTKKTIITSQNTKPFKIVAWYIPRTAETTEDCKVGECHYLFIMPFFVRIKTLVK